jgi:RimJ/RimL family protein N-acetyltransferase
MITIERTVDMKLIESVAFHPAVKKDFGSGQDKMVLHDLVYWLTPTIEGVLIGIIVFFPLYGVAWNPHIAILPEHRGNGTEVMRLGVAWMFANTECRKILAFPWKPIMMRVYDKCGFRIEGQCRKLIAVDGAPTDCLIFGKEKET